MKTILYFVDEDFLLEMAKTALEGHDIQVIGPNKDLDNLSLVQNVGPDLILLDVDHYPDLLEHLEHPTVILSGKASSLNKSELASYQKLEKPLNIKDFHKLVLL
ncbi:MAG: hypothetical protein ACO20H_12030 [Bacteriovoracaceae bacterium]